jgi:hypothetical protein
MSESISSKEKVCLGCKVSKPTSEFFKACKSKDGYNWKCKECISIREKELIELKLNPPQENTKQCRVCKITKSFTEFFAEKNGVHGLKGKCKACCLVTKQEYRKKKSDSEPAKPRVKKEPKKREVVVKPPVPQRTDEDKAKSNYDRINDYVISKGCTLLTTVQEIQENHMNSKSMYDIIGTCGHESRIKYDMFKAINCGIQCKACTLATATLKLKNAETKSADTEYTGYCYLRDQLSSAFDVQKMVEGTLSDFAIKPKTVLDDEWLPIQLKVTTKAHAQYSDNYRFRMANKLYRNIAIVLLCLEDKKVWMINGNDLPKIKSITIGSKRSKYSQYEVKNLHETAQTFYNTLPTESFHAINVPIGANQQREQDYRRKRESYLPYLEFVYPEREGLEYDFIVDNMKVQEKVASETNVRCVGDNIAYSVLIERCRMSKHIRERYLYAQGDNDYYWINIPDTTKFFLIPELVLLEYNKISPKGVTIKRGCSLGLYVYDRPQSPNNWQYKCLYDYTTITQDEMKKFFKVGV